MFINPIKNTWAKVSNEAENHQQAIHQRTIRAFNDKTTHLPLNTPQKEQERA